VNRLYLPNKKDVLKAKKSVQMGIGTLVGLTNLAIANNTVSIVITGTIAKEINDDMKPEEQQQYLISFHVLSAGFYLWRSSIAYFEFKNGKLDFFDR
jgi:Na+/H+ antiporter NhaC